jgi:hypothetical protein
MTRLHVTRSLGDVLASVRRLWLLAQVLGLATLCAAALVVVLIAYVVH